MDALSAVANLSGNVPKCIAAIYDIVGGSLSTPVAVSGGSQWKQDVVHSARGYTFPTSLNTMFGESTTTTFQMLHQDTSTTDLPTLLTRMENSVVSGTMPDGSTGNFIRMQLKTANGEKPPQAPLRIQNAITTRIPIIKEFYCQYDVFLPSNLGSLLDPSYPNDAYWLALGAFKTGQDDDYDYGDYRMSVQCQIPSGGGTIYLKVRGDNFAGLNGVDGDIIYWNYNATDITVPLNQWFKMMVYCKRPDNYADQSTGITWAGIATYTGGKMNAIQTLHTQLGGIQAGVNSNKLTRFYFPSIYTRAVPITIDWCNWELWDKSPLILPFM